MASQIPAGALVDAIRGKAWVVLLSILAFSISALLFAVQPAPLAVYVAEILHSFSSCTLGPAIAAISLAVAGPSVLGLRFGRNARFAAIGNGIGAVLMGACGYYVSERAVFFLTAALTLPALVPLLPLARLDYSPPAAGAAPQAERASPLRALGDRRLLIFACCVLLFTLGNAAMLPLIGNTLTKTVGSEASLVIAACIVVPQLIVALASPAIGRLAEARGRRIVLLLGFLTLPIRGRGVRRRRPRRSRSSWSRRWTASPAPASASWSRWSRATSPGGRGITIWRSALSALRSGSAPR